MGYPVPLRDRFFLLFVEALVAGERSLDLGDDSPYAADRRPRFERVLAAASVPRSVDQALALGAALFNEGLFYDCHEYLEGWWRAAQGADKRRLQGLIQAAAALHKLELEPGRLEGPVESLGRAIARLEAEGEGAGLLEPLRAIRDRLASGDARLTGLPKLAA